MNKTTQQIAAGAIILAILITLVWFHGNAVNYGITQSSIMCALCH